MLPTGDTAIYKLFKLPAQRTEGSARLAAFLTALRAFIGDHIAAGTHKGKAVLCQRRQRGYGACKSKIIPRSVLCVVAGLLGARMHTAYICQPQVLDDPL